MKPVGQLILMANLTQVTFLRSNLVYRTDCFFLWVNWSLTVFFFKSFLQICFEGKWVQNRLRADKNELRSLSAVDIQGHQRGGFCIVPSLTVIINYVHGSHDHIDNSFIYPARCFFAPSVTLLSSWHIICFSVELSTVALQNAVQTLFDCSMDKHRRRNRKFYQQVFRSFRLGKRVST